MFGHGIISSPSMFGFKFKKTIKLFDLPDQWTAMKGEFEGDALIVLLLNDLHKVTEKKAYPTQVGITVPVTEFNDKTQDGLKVLEEEISTIFETPQHGRLYATITQMGKISFREFVIQAQDELPWAEIHNSLRHKFPKFDVQMVANQDEKWAMYQAIKAKAG
jgi:hypothetical protein